MSRTHYIKKLLPFLFSCGSFFLAQSQENWTIFNSSNSGIPDNTVRCLLVDHQNTLWVGTDNGLSSFDGNSWTVYNTFNSPLTDNYIRALAVDSANSIYIGTTLGGVFIFDGINWANFNAGNSDLPDNFIRAITIDEQQRMWVGTVEGFACNDHGNWTIWNNANSGILSNNITSIACAPVTTHIGTINGGLIYLTNQTLVNYTLLSNNVPDNSVISVQLDQLNRPWYGSTAQGIFTDNGNQIWFTFNVLNSPLPSNSITAFEVDKYDNFLIGTHQDGFVLRENNSDWYHYNVTNSPLPENHILSCTRDSNEVIWIGTNNSGLVKLWISQAEVQELRVSKFQVYPNPLRSNEDLFWNTDEQFTEIRVYSMKGENLWSESLTDDQNKFNMPKLNTSVVFLEWRNDELIVRKRVQIID